MGDDNKADLLRFANEYAEKNVDLFELLGVDALTPKEDIHRAWRKRSLKYHPDKAGENFDASKWELFERARDILSSAEVRAAYEQSMKAKLLRRQEREAFDRERRKFADDLEARENAAKAQREEKVEKDREAMQKERARLAEAQRMRDEELKRQADAEQENDMIAEAKRRLKEKKEEKARRKLAKESNKAAGKATGKATGPLNGVVLVPGDYVVDLGTTQKPYWELVCDKLKAIQAARNLSKAEASAEEVQQAEQGVMEARRRIADAESKFRQETAAA
jgi:DnaJ family protein C protein 17